MSRRYSIMPSLIGRNDPVGSIVPPAAQAPAQGGAVSVLAPAAARDTMAGAGQTASPPPASSARPQMTFSGKKSVPPNPKREWMPHFWEGCNFPAWVRLLVRNRFRVGGRYLYVAVIVTFVSLVQTLLRWLQALIYGRRVRRTELTAPPVFIVGHWRTGTTLLHEMLILDPRHTFPTTYECLVPNNFVLTEGFGPRLLWFLMPAKRPMDNMAAGWDRPQEDEFALALLGQPSPYLTIAFPNNPPLDEEAYDLLGLSPRARRSWKDAFVTFLKQVTYCRPGRLILKSPTHTFRLRTLLELFPDAKFVHIVRDPYVVFPSTVNLWKSLYETHGLQKPRFEGLEERVLATFERMYQRFEEDRKSVPAGDLVDVRYEDLVRDPLGEVRRVYEGLELGGFEEALPRLRQFVEGQADYKTNRYTLDPRLEEQVTRRWGDMARRYGYEVRQEIAADEHR